MSDYNPMPMPPYQQQNMVYDNYGNPVYTQTYAPGQQIPVQGYPQQMYQQQMQQQPMYNNIPVQNAPVEQQNNGLGVNFNRLIGTEVSIPIAASIVPADRKKRKASTKSKDGSTEIEVVDSKQERLAIVEDIVYADSYEGTGHLLRSTISQVDELTGELKLELNKIRAAKEMRGKYTYLANISGAMTSLLGTKVMAIKEINSSIKSANEAEYRRYKDSRSVDANDDSKAIMDIYNAYIHTPVGTVPGVHYTEPSTLDLTAGLNGIVMADSISPQQRDNAFQGFLHNMTPEQNMMVHESNAYVKEVIVYDQATGKKYFDYVDTRTGEHVPNMPVTDQMFIEDFAIDPRTRTAKNGNLRTSMEVVYKNEGAFNEY